MANFETEVYELLKLFDSSGDEYDKKISSSLCTDPPPRPPQRGEFCTLATIKAWVILSVLLANKGEINDHVAH